MKRSSGLDLVKVGTLKYEASLGIRECLGNLDILENLEFLEILEIPENLELPENLVNIENLENLENRDFLEFLEILENPDFPENSAVLHIYPGIPENQSCRACVETYAVQLSASNSFWLSRTKAG